MVALWIKKCCFHHQKLILSITKMYKIKCQKQDEKHAENAPQNAEKRSQFQKVVSLGCLCLCGQLSGFPVAWSAQFCAAFYRENSLRAGFFRFNVFKTRLTYGKLHSMVQKKVTLPFELLRSPKCWTPAYQRERPLAELCKGKRDETLLHNGVIEQLMNRDISAIWGWYPSSWTGSFGHTQSA